MKQLKYIFTAALILGFSACNKDFLELEPRGTQLEGNFYKNEAEVYQGLIAAYDVMQWGTSGGYTMKMPLLSAASDDCYAGGSDPADQPNWVAWDNFTVDGLRGPQIGLWQKNYAGVYRTNLIISKIEGVTLDEAFKKRAIAEAKSLRAYYYFDLVRLFRNIPLITGAIPTAELYSQPQADPADVFAQIEKDLTEAIPDLPAQTNFTIPGAEKGRITKSAAQALLGKVILFQNDNARMAEAATVLNAVNTVADYDLIPYGEIFDPANKYNEESIWEIPHSTEAAWGDWGWVNGGEGNVGVQFVGPADYNGATFSNGWGFCPVTESLVAALTGDPRFQYTIIDGAAAKAGGATYTPRYQNTDYFIRKYAPQQAFRSTVGTAELNWPINEIEIRLADTYLMEAEALVRSGGNATRAQALLDAVRARVGLGSVAATLPNIYTERRLELATEGHRFFDLVRTGQAATVLGPRGFTANKNEVLPIPQQELDVTKGVLEQNDNY